jgi:hypothetical protein
MAIMKIQSLILGVGLFLVGTGIPAQVTVKWEDSGVTVPPHSVNLCRPEVR